MDFASYGFLFLFLPLSLAIFHLLRRRGKVRPLKLWLAAASLLYCGLGLPHLLPPLLLSGAGCWLLSRAIAGHEDKKKRRALLALALLWDLGLPATFFCVSIRNGTFGSFWHGGKTVLEAVALACYTLQLLDYLLGVYRDGKTAGPLDFCVLALFFPKLLLGPLTRREELLPQLETEHILAFDPLCLCRGVLLYAAGCSKRLLLAAPALTYAGTFYTGAAAGTVAAWAGVLSGAVGAYFGLSGWIDTARGIALLFGITLPADFDSPYRARGLGDFWQRWRITELRFFRETLCHCSEQDSTLRRLLATLAAFLLLGLYFGAPAWGLLNGSLVCLSLLWKRHLLPKPLSVLMTAFLAVLLRVPLDAGGISWAIPVWRALFVWDPPRKLLTDGFQLATVHWPLAAALLLGIPICLFAQNIDRAVRRERFGWRDALAAAVLLSLSLFAMFPSAGLRF